MTSAPLLHSLVGRFALFGGIPSIFVVGAIVALSAIDERKSLREVEERVLAAGAMGAAAELSSRNERWSNVTAAMAMTQPNGLFGQRKATSDFVKSVASEFPTIEGAYITYEPNADGHDAASLAAGDLPHGALDSAGRFVPYWYRDRSDGAIKLKPETGMESMEYYLGPKNDFLTTGVAAPFITEPYPYEGVNMVTHVHPVVIQGEFAGIAAVDRALGTLTGVADMIKGRVGADVFVLSREGRFIAATTDDDAAEGDKLAMRSASESPLASIVRRAAESGTSVFEAEDPVLGKPCFYVAAPVATGGWTVVARRSKDDVMRAANAALARNITVGAIGMAVLSVLMFGVTRVVAGRVRRAAEAADRIARGDLTEQVPESASRDETGALMRSMSAMDRNLNSLVGSVKQAGIRLNSTATEIAATSKQQEASASTFGAASSQIAAAVREISATGQDLVRTMESVSGMAAETADLAGSGRAGLQGMESVMRDLERATASIAEKLAAINERSQKITTVITTITKVADQTNILSINAAIEAEKAGEYGAGFLVIAREIRRLADQTASATLDIEQMVGQMQGAVSAGVMEMDRFSDQVRRGVRDVATVGTQLTEIIEHVNRSTESFGQVNESMQAQSEGAQQISDAMASLVANANQTMQSVQEFGKAAADLQSAIALLRQAVAQFKLRE